MVSLPSTLLSNSRFGLLKVKLSVDDARLAQLDCYLNVDINNPASVAHEHSITREQGRDFVIYKGNWFTENLPDSYSFQVITDLNANKKHHVVRQLRQGLEDLGLAFTNKQHNVTPNKFHVSV